MAEEQVVADTEWKPSKSPWLISVPTIFAAFMFVLDETVANVSLPHMAGSFSISRQESMWIITSYMVASGIMITAVDFFCKLMGRKNFFIFSIALFTISSFLCGIASSIEMMLFARIMQGLGGGGLLPVAQAVMLESFEPKERGKAMATFGLVIIIAPILGPVVGGYITDTWSWPWIFFINVPIGILAAFLTQELFEEPPYAQRQKNVEVDVWGFVYLIAWLVSMQVIFDKGNDADWFHAQWICNLTIFSVFAFLAFVLSQLTTKKPLIDLSVFLDSNFTISTTIQVIIMGIVMASLSILPQFLQSMLGYSAYLSGLATAPRGCGALLGIFIYGALSQKIDNRIFASVGLALVGISSLEFGVLNLEIASKNIIIPNIIMGIGMGMTMMPLVALSVITLRNDQMTNASGLQNTLKNIGAAMGTSIVTTIISRYSQIHQANMVGNLTPLNPVFEAKFGAMTGAFMQMVNSHTAQNMSSYMLYNQMIQQASFWGFMEAFRYCGIVALIIAPFVFILKIKGKKVNS